MPYHHYIGAFGLGLRILSRKGVRVQLPPFAFTCRANHLDHNRHCMFQDALRGDVPRRVS